MTSFGSLCRVYGSFTKRPADTLFRSPLITDRGSIPDFHSDTESYVRIKNLYNKQSYDDYKEMLELLKTNLPSLSSSDEEEFKIFCKNWFTLEAIKFRSLFEEFETLNTEFIYEGEALNGWYFVIRALDKFVEENKRVQTPADTATIRKMVDQLLASYQISTDEFMVEQRLIDEA